MGTPIVGLTGVARSGKDTAAAALVARGWQRVAFADAVRDVALGADPYVLVEHEGGHSHERLTEVVEAFGWDRAKEQADVRRFLQRLGTEGVRRHLGEQAWVRAAMAKVDGPTVFTDVRFPNEARAIHDRHGLVIRIVRPGVDRVNAHASESAMADYIVDTTITNDGDPEALGHALAGYVGRYLGI